jgi:hypothetical protein
MSRKTKAYPATKLDRRITLLRLYKDPSCVNLCRIRNLLQVYETLGGRFRDRIYEQSEGYGVNGVTVIVIVGLFPPSNNIHPLPPVVDDVRA